MPNTITRFLVAPYLERAIAAANCSSSSSRISLRQYAAGSPSRRQMVSKLLIINVELVAHKLPVEQLSRLQREQLLRGIALVVEVETVRRFSASGGFHFSDQTPKCRLSQAGIASVRWSSYIEESASRASISRLAFSIDWPNQEWGAFGK